MINLIFKTVLAALNKNQMGKISPSEYNSFLTEILNKIYAELFADFRKLSYRKMRFQDSAGYGNEVFNQKQILEYYVTQKSVTTNGRDLILPEDIMLLISLFDTENEFEKTDLNVYNTLIRSKKMKPTSCCPIYTFNDGTLNVFPFNSNLEVNYFRQMKKPKWTYEIINGVEMFNQDAPDFQDIDMHALMMSRIFNEVLSLCGLNLQAQQVQEYVNMMKQESMMNKQ